MADAIVPVKMIEVGGKDQNVKSPPPHRMGHPLRVQVNGRKVRATSAPLPKEVKPK